jgi:hypothetical protein
MKEHILKTILILLTVVCFTLCVIFYSQRNRAIFRSANTVWGSLPDLIFEDWFVFFVITTCFGCYSILLLMNHDFSLTFILTSIVLLVSFTLFFAFLYFSPRSGSLVGTMSFNIFFNSIILIFYLILNSRNYIIFTILLLPFFIFSIYAIYIGKLISST